MRTTRVPALTLTGLLALAALSACGTSDDATPPADPPPASQAPVPGDDAGSTSTAPATGTGSAGGSPSSSASSPSSAASPSGDAGGDPTGTAASERAPECRAADLSAAYEGGDAATSHRFGTIVLTNTSDHACFTRGYGGLSYVGGGDGQQVGAAADRDRGTPVTRVVLQPGERAASEVSEATTGPYANKECHPTPVDGFRVYVPDETRSLYVKHATTGCAADDVHLLSHQAFAATS